MLLSDVCLSACRVRRAYKSRTERPRKTKIDTDIAHVTRDLDTIRSRSRWPGRFTQRGFNA